MYHYLKWCTDMEFSSELNHFETGPHYTEVDVALTLTLTLNHHPLNLRKCGDELNS